MAKLLREDEKNEIRQWFQTGAADGYQYMLVATDLRVKGPAFQNPYYYMTVKETEQGGREHVQKGLIEIFDLSQDIEMQMDAKISLYLPDVLRQFEMEKIFSVAEMVIDGTASPDGATWENCPQVWPDAICLYSQVLELGFHERAALRLGRLYIMGKDYKRAFEMFERVAGINCSEAFDMLSQLCWRGEGTKQDYAEAARWAVKAICVMNNPYCKSVIERMRNDPENMRHDIFAYYCLYDADIRNEPWAAPLIEKMFADGKMPITRDEADKLLYHADEE